MKKLGVIFLFCLATPILLRANPLPPPPYISEIYFEGNEWFIEVVLWDDVFWDTNLDNYRLVCSSGQAQFKLGIDIIFPEWMIITQDSMLTPLTINKFGDFVDIEYQFNNEAWSSLGMPIYFGDFEYSWVNYPFEGQSIVNKKIPDYDFYYFYWPVKDNSPTPGSSFFETTAHGTIAGRVLDKNLVPVGGIEIKYCSNCGWTLPPFWTDSDGYFSHNMYARNYEISLMWGGISLLDTLVTIEPDSTTWCDYYLDTILVDIPENMITTEISFGNYPNPFSDNTTFVVKLPEGQRYQEGRIVVYDMTGKEVYNQVIRQEMVGSSTVFHQWNPGNNPEILQLGEYISCLVLDGAVVGKTKSICVR